MEGEKLDPPAGTESLTSEKHGASFQKYFTIINYYDYAQK